jgi:hypothetical protein
VAGGERVDSSTAGEADRRGEWFVPRIGPPGLRTAIGLLFLPYTGMVLAYTVMGALIAPRVRWDRVMAGIVVYFLGLGIAAHALDAVGSRAQKPWGAVFSRKSLWLVAAASLALAYGIGAYFMIRYVPWLWPVAVLEGFFVLAYNLEWFGGRFHSDGWFCFSWGFLPLVAGYILQTNTISAAAVLLGVSTALLSAVEIKASRPYKELKKRRAALGDEEARLMARYEAILKSVSLGVILLAAGLLAWRVLG